MKKRIRKTRFQQLHLIITIIAALITTGICALTRVSLYHMAVLVSSVIVIFYILGQVVRLFLQQVLKPDEPLSEEILEGETENGVISDNNGYDDDFSNSFAEFDEAGRR